MYNIGQFRSTQLNISDYSTALQGTLGYEQKQSSDGSYEIFRDLCLTLTGNNIMNIQNCYYLKFGVVKNKDSKQTFYLKLKNTNLNKDNEQLIDIYEVPKGTGTVYFEVIVSPNATYNQILWQLQRIPDDYRTMQNYGQNVYWGRLMSLKQDSLIYKKLVDILPILRSSYPGMTSLTKIGIQSKPSLLMCINRQQIRVGRNGIYEINNGIKITSLSFMPKQENNRMDYFIVDFEF